jgi:hypothetical protein
MSKANMIVPAQFDFSGGLNLDPTPENIEDNEAQELVNFDVTDKGLIKRAGIALRGTLPGVIGTSWITGQGIDLVNNVIALYANAADGKIYRSIDGGVNWVECLSGGFSFGTNISKMLMYNNSMVFATPVGGGGGVYAGAINGTSIPFIASSPAGITGAITLDRFFIYNAGTQVVRYSEPGNFSSWPAANTFVVGGNGHDGDYIQCLLDYKDKLVIIKQRTIWVLHMTGTPINWTLRKVFQGFGCNGLNSAMVIDDWIYFIGQFGIYRTNLSDMQKLSDPLDEAFVRRRYPGALVSMNFAPIWVWDVVVPYRDKIIFAFSPTGPEDVSVPQRIFVFHTKSETWSEYYFIGSQFPANTHRITTAIEVRNTRTSASGNLWPHGVYFTNSVDNKVYRMGSDLAKTDVIGPFACTAKSKTFDFDDIGSMKKIPYAFADVDLDALATINVSYSEGVSGLPTTGLASTKSAPIKFKGPGYVRKTFMYFVISATGAADVTLRKFGFNIRVPRPVGIKSHDYV